MAKSSPLSGRIGSRFGGRGARKRRGIFAGFITLIAVTYFGSTFAASISLGTAPIQFGQGSRAAVACDDTGISTAIAETWDTASNTFFKVDTITLSGINNAVTNATTGIGCRGKKLKVSLIGSAGKLGIGTGGTPATEISIVLPGADGEMSTGVTGASASAVVVADYIGEDAASLTITVPATINAANVIRIALETE